MGLLDSFLLEGLRLNFWVAIRTDGVLGCGSQADPLNAANGQFDAVMIRILATPEGLTVPISVFLGPGIFETKGYRVAASGTESSASGWQPRAGMKLLGSGIGVTTLRVSNATNLNELHYAVGHALGAASMADHFEIADLTIDCNLTAGSPAVACGAVRLMGNHTRIRRVRAINWGTKSTTRSCFVFTIITATSGSGGFSTVDAGIEECLAELPASGGNQSNVTIFHVGGTEASGALDTNGDAFGTGPFIRSCFVDCGLTGKTGKYRGLSLGWCRLGIVESNHVQNTDVGGPYQDRASSRDLVVRGNAYRNVARGPFWNLGMVNSPAALNLATPNSIIRDTTDDASGKTAKATTASSHNLTAGDRVRVVPAAGSPTQYQGVFVVKSVPANNQFRYLMESDPGVNANNGGTAQLVLGVGKLLVEDNYFELYPELAQGMGSVAIQVEDNNSSGSYQESPDYVHGEVVIRGNRIRYLDGILAAAPSDVFVVVNGAKGLIVGGNTFDATSLTPIQNARCGTVTSYNNIEPARLASEVEDNLVIGLLCRA